MKETRHLDRKVREASFFLDRLEGTGGKGAEFRYFFSAFLAAIRSVPLVLQSDLRAEFGDRFDDWWKDRKASLQYGGLSFNDLVRLRNTALKNGSPISRYVFDLALENDLVGTAQFEVIEDRGKLAESRLTIEAAETALPIARQPGEDRDSFLARAEREAVELGVGIVSAIAGLTELPSFTRTRYGVMVDAEPITFEGLVAAFREHVSAMEQVIGEAEAMFASEDARP